MVWVLADVGDGAGGALLGAGGGFVVFAHGGFDEVDDAADLVGGAVPALFDVAVFFGDAVGLEVAHGGVDLLVAHGDEAFEAADDAGEVALDGLGNAGVERDAVGGGHEVSSLKRVWWLLWCVGSALAGEACAVEVGRALCGGGVVHRLLVAGLEGGVHAALAFEDAAEGDVEVVADFVGAGLELVEGGAAGAVELAFEGLHRGNELLDERAEVVVSAGGVGGEGGEGLVAHIELHECTPLQKCCEECEPRRQSACGSHASPCAVRDTRPVI
ncbi:hypothetical protein DAD186_00950 [Dermabacter vaginalis]|uniref:Uncharacterized protein n=1 Tax=Dermabacter vaginalis TaxID=1630135 RepID=A0A1B0ZFA9_9MICO|nr:hypothetical protein DAD186_00850 [Dermabacter vaginalis]ANP26648.1 hypothetical protein DAD186_00890 [Dermabacter vaginalis]ANP26654.1 hypothetical protein DAD186_00950 [Dermabacter vaginalis]